MPGLWALLAWVRRQSAYTLDNTTALPERGWSAPHPTGGTPPNWQPPPLAIGPETPGATGIFDLTAIYNMWVYQPLNGAVQFWITSRLGKLSTVSSTTFLAST